MEDLGTPAMLEVADSIMDASPASVTLTGGEPLLRDDLELLAARLVSGGILVGVATNGILLEEDRVKSLAAAGVGWFEIPLHAPGGEILEELTGADCFGQVKRAMNAVKKAGSRLTVSHILTSRNFSQSDSAVRLAMALGAEAVALNRFVPTGAGSARPDLVPMPCQLDEALEAAAEVSRRSPGIRVIAAIPVEDCLHPHDGFPGIEFGSCSCGLSKWAVSPSGDLRFCEQSPVVLGSLLESTFLSLTDDPSVEEFRSATLRPECSECIAWARCGGGCRCMREYRQTRASVRLAAEHH